MAGSSWPTLSAGSRARASDVEAKFDWVEGNIVPMLGGSATDAAYDLGTSTGRWRDSWLSRRILIGLNTSTTGFFQGRSTADASLMFAGNTAFTTTAVSINAINDSNSALIPLEIRSSKTRITTGDFALPDTSTAVSGFSTDPALSSNSDAIVPTQKAVKAYVDGFPLAGVGTASSALGPLIGSLVGTGTITALSVTADGGKYEFRFSGEFDGTVGASGQDFGLVVEIVKGSLGSTGGSSADAVPGGFRRIQLFIPSTSVNPIRQSISLHTLMSLTSGGHTFYMMYATSGFNAPISWAFSVRKFSN